MQKKIALLHRYPANRIKETNAAFPHLASYGMDVLTFKKFDRSGFWGPLFKSILWVFYAPFLVLGKGYDVIYCDDSFPFYPALVKLASPHSKVVIRLGDFHLMYHTSGLFYRFLHFFEKIGWRLSDVIIAISPAMQQKLRSEGFFSLLALDPVDPDDFPIQPVPQSCDVMFHGVLTRNKNVDVLLEAARRLPDYRFKVIGYGPDFQRLKSIAPKNVFFYGWAPFRDMAYHISGCKVGVALRSNNPGNEYVVTSAFLQYGVMGKPCLVTRRKVFSGYKWQFSGADEMVGHLDTLLCFNDPKEEGQSLREYVLQNHDAKKIAGEIWQILTSL